ncbi:MAG: 23S rRNA (uracil(1939)-C(5))-methyltransferase RlmD [Clostridiales Family XIII bacterium]|jgi:23S rRNA (uracil1939-C5)-methyltransferase|nr:23S rRNA (uracil(1939)-C(5))-methyltransferase RlmD [Clostridiales Family XIII bacterium]
MIANIGDRLVVEVSDVGRDGRGIGRAEGLTVFADGLIPGDKALVTVTKMKKNMAFAAAGEILEPSPFRVSPECGLAGACGGCPLMAMEYSAQAKMKEGHVRAALSRIGGISDPKVRPIVSMGAQWGYRNKAVYAAAGDKVGFYGERSHALADVPYCPIQTSAANALAGALRSFGPAAAGVNALTVRSAFGTGEVMAVLGLDRRPGQWLEGLIMALDDAVGALPAFGEDGRCWSLESVAGVFPGKQDGAKMRQKCEIIAGKGTITELAAERRMYFEISPQSFFQVNPEGARALESILLEYAGLSGGEAVVDLYCGVGVWGLVCAPYAKEVIGIEIEKQAVADANRNAVINRIVNARYICGKAEAELPAMLGKAGAGLPTRAAKAEAELPAMLGRTGAGLPTRAAKAKAGSPRLAADVAIIDPPRAGCAAGLLEAAAAIAPARIVYISCDPATLARDVRMLEGLGYRFVEASPVDMFPHTVHVEAVALMERAGH